jgi:hypothetical protein
MENLCHAKRKALGWSALKAIRFVHLAIVGDGLDRPVDPCRTWLSLRATWSTLGQCTYLDIYTTRVLTTSPIFDSTSNWGIWCGLQIAENTDSRVSACYLLLSGKSNKAMTLGL